jgi:thioredoxin 1
MSVQIISDDDIQSVANAHEFVVVKFYADWCGSCKLLAPAYRRLSSDPRYPDVVFLDVDVEVSPQSRKLVGVDNLPFFAAFRKGALVEAGATAKEETVIAMLDRLVA